MAEEKKVIKVEDIKNDAESSRACPVDQSLYYINEFLSGPMCGKCFPCSLGCYEARIILSHIIEGNGTEEELLNLKRIAGDMLIGSMCKKGKDTARFILEWMETDVFKKHLEGICPDKTCIAFVEYRIIPEKCDLCGICVSACKYGAIHGEKKKPFLSGYHPFEIRQLKCVKCGDCLPVCPTGAIILVDARAGAPVEV